jgi:hypothetical protein
MSYNPIKLQLYSASGALGSAQFAVEQSVIDTKLMVIKAVGTGNKVVLDADTVYSGNDTNKTLAARFADFALASAVSNIDNNVDAVVDNIKSRVENIEYTLNGLTNNGLLDLTSTNPITYSKQP